MNTINVPDNAVTSSQQFFSALREHTDARLKNQIPDGKASFIAAASTYPDLVCEFLVLLRRHDARTHQYLWLFTLTGLTEVSVAIFREFERLTGKPNAQITAAMAAMTSSLQNVCDMVGRFMSTMNLDLLFDSQDKSFWRALAKSLILTEEKVICGELLDLLENTLDLVFLGRDLVDVSSTFILVNAIVTNYYKGYVALDLASTHLAECFESVVLLAKTAFYLGQPQAIVPLFAPSEGEQILSEMYPCDLLAFHSLDFRSVMDYYRYVAYCLATLGAHNTYINDRFVDTADLFFKVLLNMPNMNPRTYLTAIEFASVPGAAANAQQSGKQHISLKEREELSFFFMINYMLRMKSLNAFISPDTYWQEENTFFGLAFSRRVSSDLDHLASVTQSYTNSVVSMQRLEQQALAVDSGPNSRTLSAIFHDGTYKEKIQLVGAFFKQRNRFPISNFVQLFNFSGALPDASFQVGMMHNDMQHLVSRINGDQYPGKKLYIHVMDKIVRLLQLLTIRHLYASAGLASDPEALLAKLFHTTYSFRDITQVRKAMDIDEHGKLVREYNGLSKLEDEQIAAQFRLLETTQDLEDFLVPLI